MTEPIATDPGGDMTTGTASAHLETPAEIEAIETDIAVDTDKKVVEAPVVGPSYTSQHAKVLRFEVSIGKTDDARTIEEFERDIKLVLSGDPVGAKNVTVLGGYYIIDGKVCLPPDYDAAAKNRKPGTNPPSWAGGPSGPSKGYTPPIPADESKADTVRRLAENVGAQLEGKK